MQGGAAISKDLPPYTMARGHNGICGLNTVGLRRAGFSATDRLELKQLYHALFRNGLNLRAAVAQAQKSFSSASARAMLDFVSTAKRSICVEVGRDGAEDTEETD
jgi:UDP-N-acetylglucosamine acyltransferase